MSKLGKREAAEAVILEFIEKLLPGSANTGIYKKLFESFSDREFDDFIRDPRRLAVITPNNVGPQLSIERNLELAKELKHEFFQRIWMENQDTGGRYLTPHKYLVIDLPLRRQAQVLTKKISIPTDNSTINNLTGQVTGSSKGSRLSYPEMQILASAGLDNSIVELMKYRGGDLKGLNAMNTMISRTGGVSQKAILPFSGRVMSTHAMQTVLTCMHLKTAL